MKHSLLKQRINDLEKEIFNCNKCEELFTLRQKRIHNCPVLGFDFNHYLNARICSIAEAPGVYKPHKGEVYIEKLEQFHDIYDNRIQNIARVGKLLMEIYGRANVGWEDIQHFNAVCCSPPEYRRPTIDEIDNCLSYLAKRIALMQNIKLIVTFGKAAKVAIKRLKLNKPIVSAFHTSYIFTYMPMNEREGYINQIASEIKTVLNA